MTQFAFDVTLSAVIRVTAENEIAARGLMDEVLDCCSIPNEILSYSFYPTEIVELTEFSLLTGESSGEPALFEVDGENVDEEDV